MTKTNLFESQLFLDDHWIADSIHVQRIWHPARKRAEPVLLPSETWEGIPVMFGSVLYHDGKFRMWYCNAWGAYRGFMSYAESPDGIHWIKPRLGLVEINGNRHNNVLWARPDTYVDNLGVIDDPADRAWPLKLIYWAPQPQTNRMGLWAARSADGIHWDQLGQVLPDWGDRTNILPTRENGKYVVFGRDPSCVRRAVDRYGWRVVSRVESEDLIHWSKPELVLKPDPEDEAHLEIYSATAFRYESLYLGFIERMHMTPDVLDPEIWFSRDSHRWARSRTRLAFIERGPKYSWDGAWVNLPSSGPIRRNGELLFHYSGRACAHTHHDSYHFGGIGLASLRVDGFCSLQGSEQGGWLVTPSLRWVRGELHLNADPRRDITAHPDYRGGEVGVEIRDARSRPLAGYTFDDCVPITRNTAHRTNDEAVLPIEWKSRKKMAALAGRQVRLAFRLRDAHLYSFKAK